MKKVFDPKYFTQEELEKCNADRLYFYNTYFRPEGQPELSEKEFKEYEQLSQFMKNGGIVQRSRRIGHTHAMRVMTSMMVELPEFIKSPAPIAPIAPIVTSKSKLDSTGEYFKALWDSQK